MRMNKILFYISSIITIIALLFLVLFTVLNGQNIWLRLLENITLGVFGSALVTLFIALGSYFYEKNKMIDKISNTLIDIYRYLGCILDTIDKSPDVQNKIDNFSFDPQSMLQENSIFKQIHFVLNRNQELVDDVVSTVLNSNFRSYSPFFCKKDIIIQQIFPVLVHSEKCQIDSLTMRKFFLIFDNHVNKLKAPELWGGIDKVNNAFVEIINSIVDATLIWKSGVESLRKELNSRYEVYFDEYPYFKKSWAKIKLEYTNDDDKSDK